MSRDPLGPSNRPPSQAPEEAPATDDLATTTAVGSKDSYLDELRPRPTRNAVPSPNEPLSVVPPNSALGVVQQLVADLTQRMERLEEKVGKLGESAERPAQQPGAAASGPQAAPGQYTQADLDKLPPEVMAFMAFELGQVVIPSASAEFGHQKLAPHSELGRAVKCLLEEGGYVALTGVKST